MDHMKRKNQRSSYEMPSYALSQIYSQYMLFHVTSGHAKETIRFYTFHLGQFLGWAAENGIENTDDIDTVGLRNYFAQYQEGHTRNGANIVYRAIKAFLRWVWDEYDIEERNPIDKIHISADPVVPIEGVNPKDIDKLFESANPGDYPERDCALLAVLLDTGIRKSSFINILKSDVDLTAGTIYIRHTKNHRPMTVYLGNKARKYMRKYFQTIKDIPKNDPLWITEYGESLSIDGVREILRRMCKRAGIPEYSAHDFRRYFALQTYRNGADIYAVSELLGHTGIEVTKRYLAITDEDRKMVHAKTSPLDLNGMIRPV